MLFSSIPFIYYFLPCVLILYFASPKSWKNTVLLLSSLVFYAWGEPAYVFLMAGSILIGYGIGLAIEKYPSKILLAVGVIFGLGFLAYFKYANFFIENVNAATGLHMNALQITLPIGISFYTFQLISYLIDVYRGDVKAQRNLIALAAYITMFPQLIAGPIVRYSDVEKELNTRTHTFEKTAYGIRRFVLGLSKKILIANVLAEFCNTFHGTNDKSIVFYWAYAVAVSLQIYFDFSGYSDMAIGLGSMLGFRFVENFQYPFISKSITEFWRRWHMSLGTWFRDYVYIPLGGNRGSRKRQIFNLLVVWCLTGFWHGAEWTFFVWGLYFAVLLIVEKMFFYQKLNQSRVIGHLYTGLLVLISFVIFDATSLESAWNTIQAMFGMGNLPLLTATTTYYLGSYTVIFLIACVGATSIPCRLVVKIDQKLLDWMEPVVMILLLITVTAYLVDGSFNPFLYFRF